MSAVEYLEVQRIAHPELTEHYAELADLYKKKLWHQLTLKIEQFIALPQLQAGDQLIHFYHKFIRDFEMKVNLLTLVKIVIAISKHFAEFREAIAFMQVIVDKVKGDSQAHLLALSVLAGIKLKLKQVNECKETIELAKAELDNVASLDAVVYAYYYKVWADYYRDVNSPVDFYKHALMYLAYVPLESVPLADQMTLAFDLGLAALIGDNIYNFGELLAHDVLKSLTGTPVEWLVEMLRVFNRGDISAYEQLVLKYRDQLNLQPALTANQSLLVQKISILSLMELAFKRPSDKRTIPFADIALATKLPHNEVEHLLMKGLSLKLIRGTIDQVSQTVTISWVQPRVLDIVQISSMKDRLAQWTQKVQSTLLFMENETPELLA